MELPPRVSDVMREVAVTASESDPLLLAVKLMMDNKISVVLVTDETDAPVGILTERDVVKAVDSSGGSVAAMTVGSIMTRSPITITKDASILKAIHIMAKHGIRHLPVVDENGFLEGIVSIRDVAVEVARMLVDMEVMGGVTEEERELIRSLRDEVDVNIDEGGGGDSSGVAAQFPPCRPEPCVLVGLNPLTKLDYGPSTQQCRVRFYFLSQPILARLMHNSNL